MQQVDACCKPKRWAQAGLAAQFEEAENRNLKQANEIHGKSPRDAGDAGFIGREERFLRPMRQAEEA